MTEINRREFVKLSSLGLAGLLVPDWLSAAPNLRIIDYPSPKRKTRPSRSSTDYIFLHTTEGGVAGALDKLTRRGEASYMIDTNGDVYRIMERDQVSYGVGRSMWQGKTNLDNHAINIEFVGRHNIKPTENQLRSGKEIIRQLRDVYRNIRDEDIMPHSMVAYGKPNRNKKRSHRGRKRCGMFFEREDIREAFGLRKVSRIDNDVISGRLVVEDPYLESVLYGGRHSVRRSIEHTDEPEEILSTISKGESPRTYAGDEYADSTTVYFFNDGRVRRGDELRILGFNFKSVSPGTKIAVGYVYGGNVSKERGAYTIAGRNWNLSSTVYRLPNGEIKTGDDINDSAIPKGTIVLFRR